MKTIRNFFFKRPEIKIMLIVLVLGYTVLILIPRLLSAKSDILVAAGVALVGCVIYAMSNVKDVD